MEEETVEREVLNMERNAQSHKGRISYFYYIIGLLLMGIVIFGGARQSVLAAEDITKVEVLYQTEELQVTSSKQVYYAPAKKETDTAVKSTTMIPAARSGTSNIYYIDYSAMSSTKDLYIGLATNMTADAKGMVAVKLTKVGAAPKKVVFSVNWAYEGASKKTIFSSVLVTSASGQAVTYKALGATPATDTIKDISSLGIQWKKGANGNWADVNATLLDAQWQSCINSKTTVYFRLEAVGGSRMSKEVKIKSAASKAPSIKIDVNKLSLPIKNGMEYRFENSVPNPGPWFTILPYKAKHTQTAYIKIGTNIFDPNVDITKTKIAYMDIRKILTASGSDVAVASGSAAAGTVTPVSGAYTIHIRTAATTKKPASPYTAFTIPAQAEAPLVKATFATEGGLTFTEIKRHEKDTTGQDIFEFLIMKELELPKLDLKSATWTTAKINTKLSPTVKSSFKLSDGVKVTSTLADPGIVVLVRRKGTPQSSKAVAVLASQYTIIKK